MTGKAQRPPSGEPWVKIPRELLASDAWRSLGVNARRLLDFLMLEHMNRGGKHNGRLKAPRHQLHDFGIGARHVTGAIFEAEKMGLLDCHRGGMRVATTYALTWLPLHDGAPATNQWRAFRDPTLAPLPARKSRNLVSEGKSGLVSEGKSDGPNLVSQGKSDRPKSLVSQGIHLLRKDLTTAKPNGCGGRGHAAARLAGLPPA